jgi:hypothetical protein
LSARAKYSKYLTIKMLTINVCEARVMKNGIRIDGFERTVVPAAVNSRVSKIAGTA